MLNHITIRNFAIVDTLSLDLQAGMSVLTGETGAGKSILLDALNLALGDRADSGNIRHDAERAEISVQFSIKDNSAAQQWLTEQALDQDNECLIRRVISREGRSKGFINGSPVPMQSLRDIGEMLVDIHGQHEHQSLLKRDIQRQLVDDYAGNQDILLAIKNLYREWQQKHTALEQLKKSASERESRRELLQYQVQELENLELTQAELVELPDEQARLANAEKLRSTVQTSLYELYDAEQSSTHQALSQITRSLEDLLDYDPKLKDIVVMLDNAAIQIQEAGSDLRNYLDTIELDPERLTWIEERIGVIHELSRKHHVAPETLPDLLTELSTELLNLNDADHNLDTLEQELQALEQQYHDLSRQLGERRAKAAKKLDKSVTDTIRELGMPSISFTIQLERKDNNDINIHGHETIEFMISPNPGQPQKPLRKIASGGELSRISLAIQTVLADTTHIPTLIYDEVDSGIGGPTAEVVGRKLHVLGERCQVLCVTHLAQVASQAHHHLLVSKQASNNTTTSQMQTLDEEQRILETARMLGGIDITKQSLSHAREMIERGQQPKKKQTKKSRKSA